MFEHHSYFWPFKPTRLYKTHQLEGDHANSCMLLCATDDGYRVLAAAKSY